MRARCPAPPLTPPQLESDQYPLFTLLRLRRAPALHCDYLSLLSVFTGIFISGFHLPSGLRFPVQPQILPPVVRSSLKRLTCAPFSRDGICTKPVCQSFQPGPAALPHQCPSLLPRPSGLLLRTWRSAFLHPAFSGFRSCWSTPSSSCQ